MTESPQTGQPRCLALRTDFLDASSWVHLASVQGVRLPRWSTVCTPGSMEKWLRKVKVSRAEYLAWSGETSLKDFARANPSWPLRAWVGVLLEWICAAE